MKFLVTGAAGFIGYHVAERLLAAGHQVVGIDNLNDYYDVGLKMARLDRLADKPGFRFIKLDLADREGMATLFAEHQFQRVIHLGAQAGVRYSLINPLAYADANLIGHLNVLEGCRHNKVEHLLYASSSSVYGLNRKLPFATEDSVDHPVSLYAATKKANELMAHSYSHLYGLPTTGLRFFTVYGPWGRPDMALFKFTKAILAGRASMYITTVKCTVTLLTLMISLRRLCGCRLLFLKRIHHGPLSRDRRRPVRHRIMFIISAIAHLLN